MNLADLRKEYTLKVLSEESVHPHPIEQFSIWMNEAIRAEIPEPTAMHLATVSAEGKPSLRVVLLKGIENEGFVFFTNYESQKGKELAQNPYACVNFFWAELERQVRIEGKVEKISEEASTQYFQSRPRGSQVGAWASPQSQVIPHRAFLEQKVVDYEKKFEHQPVIPKPPYWGGYVLFPSAIEFWQGRQSRLHDRIRYRLVAPQQWKIERLAP